MNDLKFAIQIASIGVAFLIYIGIWYWIWAHRNEYLRTLYINDPWNKFISECCFLWILGHIVGVLVAILWAWL